MEGCHVTPPDMKKVLKKQQPTTSPTCLKETLVALSDSAEKSRQKEKSFLFVFLKKTERSLNIICLSVAIMIPH